MAEVIYRLAEPEDLDELCELEELCFPEEPWSRAMLSAELENSTALFVTACEAPEDSEGSGDGRMIGYMIAWIIDPLECQIGSIAVRPDSRRRGVASGFMDILIDTCAELRTYDIYLEVRVSNTAAIELYKRYGFKVDGIRKKYYQDGEDAYNMSRTSG